MRRPFAAQPADLLTASRLLLAPLFVVAIWRAERSLVWGIVAGLVFTCVAASDIIDGRVARRLGSASNRGRTFDHLADIGFILTALSAYAYLGDVPWWVPAAIGASFGFYVLDSWSRTVATTPELLGSRIGHAAGVLNYALIGVLVFNNSAGIRLLSPAALAKLFWLVPIYSFVAVISRRISSRTSVPAAKTASL